MMVSQSARLAVSNDKNTTQRLSVFVGHSLGVGYPSSHLIPDKLLSPWRVSLGHQPDSLSPGSIYNIYNWLFSIKIFTILCTIICAINNINKLDVDMIQFYYDIDHGQIQNGQIQNTETPGLGPGIHKTRRHIHYNAKSHSDLVAHKTKGQIHFYVLS